MTKMFVLNDEEKCALIDIVRYQDASAVAEKFRHQLLLRIATAAVTTLYQDLPLPKAVDIENFPPSLTEDPSDRLLAMTFIMMQPLTTDSMAN